MTFVDRLDAAVSEAGNPCLVGVDPHVDLLPNEFSIVRSASARRATRADALGAFCRQLVELVAGRVPAVKPQAAFFEVFGADGVRAWEDVVACAHAHDLLVIGDVKRSDIASTAAAYATAFLEGPGGPERSMLCDAVTINPFLGEDSVEPFLAACRRTGTGVFVLVRTSNPGSRALQLHGEPPLSMKIARDVERWGSGLLGECGFSSVGAVVGATHADELLAFRRAMPRTPFLLPGYGAQGAGAADIVDAFPDDEHPLRGAIVNSSRGIAFAWRKPENEGRPWQDAASDALDAMIADLRSALLS